MTDLKKEERTCCLCDGVIEPIGGWLDGHNAYPLSDGRCCTACNDHKVLPARIDQILAKARPQWKVVPDSCVKHVWVCEVCLKKQSVPPDWYEQNGTCECSDCQQDMQYVETLILTEG